MPKVSIVMPAFNRAQTFLPQAIESVLSQSFQDFELIIVDDHSHDNTQEVALSYAKKDPRVKVFRNEENLKLPKTLNEGFSHATGDYWTWISDDNEFTPDAIRTMVNFLDLHHQIDCIFGSEFEFLDENGKVTDYVHCNCGPAILAETMPWVCFLYRKSIAQKVGGYDPDMFCAEDHDFFCRIALQGRVATVPGILMQFRRHSTSLSDTQSLVVKDRMRDIQKKYGEEINKKYPIQEGIFVYRTFLKIPILVNDVKCSYTKDFDEKISLWYFLCIIPFLRIRSTENKVSYRLFFIFPILVKHLPRYYYITPKRKGVFDSIKQFFKVKAS